MMVLYGKRVGAKEEVRGWMGERVLTSLSDSDCLFVDKITKNSRIHSNDYMRCRDLSQF